MTAIISNFVDIVNSLLVKSQLKLSDSRRKHLKVSEEHSKNLIRPPVYHQFLNNSFINEFNEIIVIGDVHGCYDEMIELINKIESTKKKSTDKILKVFVGDLINKGPKNKEVLNYLMTHRNDCISVRGNHEEICIKTYNSHKENGKNFKKSDTKYIWAKDLTEEELEFLISLPYTISIPQENSIIVHAGLVTGIQLDKQDPYDLVHMRNYVFENNYYGESIRPVKSNSEGKPWAPFWSGPQHVYFGHNSKLGYQDCKFATGLDTGCVSGGHLTGLFIKGNRKKELIKITPKQTYKVKHKAKLGKKLKNDLNVTEISKNITNNQINTTTIVG